MEQKIGKCFNPDCSQLGLEKSVLVAVMHGYGQGKTVVCPECDNLLVVNRQHRTIRQRVARILDLD